MANVRTRLPSASKPAEEYFDDMSKKETFLQVSDHLRKEEVLTDITLIVEGHKFPAHKVVLAAASDYFHAMFTGPLACHGNVLQLYGITASTVHIVLEYIYKGEIVISEDNIFDLLDASCLLLLQNLQNRCAKFLKDRLDFENCLQIFTYAKKFSLYELVEFALDYVATVFSDISKTFEFKQLAADELIDILSLEHLSVDSEDSILDCVIKWLESDIEEREKELTEVMKYVRLNYVDQTYLENIIEVNDFVKNNAKLMRFIKFAIQGNYLDGDNGTCLCNSWSTPRKILKYIPSVIAMGGPTLNIYNSKYDQWAEITKCNPRHCSGMDVIGADIYIVGGSLEWRRKATGEKFSTETNQWTQISPMTTSRSNFGLVRKQGKLYAIGGYDGDVPLKTCEVYDPDADQWSRIASLTNARDGPCCVSDGELVYAIGGYSGSRYLLSSEVYDEETGSWNGTMLPAMAVERQNAMSAYIDGFIFVIGGYMGDTYHASGEMFDLESNEWKQIAPLPEPRHHAGAAAMNGHVYVCGGWSSQIPVTYFDMYSIENDTWTRLASLPIPTMIRCALVDFPKKSILKLFRRNDDYDEKFERHDSIVSDSLSDSVIGR